jgi:hypothetical protein
MLYERIKTFEKCNALFYENVQNYVPKDVSVLYPDLYSECKSFLLFTTLQACA